MKTELKFEGIDNWNRPIFKDLNNNRYGSVCTLFRFTATYEDVIKKLSVFNLSYFGKTFGCEPFGASINPDNFILVKEFTKTKVE